MWKNRIKFALGQEDLQNDNISRRDVVKPEDVKSKIEILNSSPSTKPINTFDKSRVHDETLPRVVMGQNGTIKEESDERPTSEMEEEGNLNLPGEALVQSASMVAHNMSVRSKTEIDKNITQKRYQQSATKERPVESPFELAGQGDDSQSPDHLQIRSSDPDS